MFNIFGRPTCQKQLRGGKAGMKELIRQLDSFFVEKFRSWPDVVSIFVVGSMYDLESYNFRQNNDYDIRLLVTKVSPQLLQYIEHVRKEWMQRTAHSEVHMEYNMLVGPVNHHLSDQSVNLLIHLIVHRVDDLTEFLPLTHQYCYRTNHRILWGDDYLSCLCQKFSPQYLIECHEGIQYCVDMLQRKVYKCLYWKPISETETVFQYEEEMLPPQLQNESIFYSLKNVLNNLYNACIICRGVSGVTLDAYCEWLCGGNSAYLTLVKATLARDENALESYLNPDARIRTAVELLLYLQKRIECGQVEKMDVL